MRNIAKRLFEDEKGSALLLALILLLVSGLIAAPLLAHMGTGIVVGEVYERRTNELYAADAGVEDAIWSISHESIPPDDWHECDDQPGWWIYEYPEPLTVNGKSVDVSVYRKDLDPTSCGEDLIYRILAMAITEDPGGVASIPSTTTIEAYIEPLVFDLLSGALVSMTDITFKSDAHPCSVTGNVYYVGTITGEYDHISGNETQVPVSVFPTQEQNDAFAQQFKDEALSGEMYGAMTISSDTSFSGPVYFGGDLYIEKDVTIELAGTIYVEGSITAKQDYTITGSGSIVAVDDIYLSKVANYGIEGDTVIMSRSGDIIFKKDATINAFVYAPNGDFTIDKNITVLGGLIGASITVKKDGSFTYVSKASSYGFPIWVPYGAEIKTYSISQG